MFDNALVKKLQLKPDWQAVVINAPGVPWYPSTMSGQRCDSDRLKKQVNSSGNGVKGCEI
jgi:hypothetical protein